MTDRGAHPNRRWTDRGAGRALRIAQIVTSLVAIAALIVAIMGLVDVTNSRRDSARDSCLLLRGLVLKATTPSRAAAVHAYIANTPLRDCDNYAMTVVR